MSAGLPRPSLVLSIFLVFVTEGSAQTLPGKPAPPKRVEPGLENAVKWEWRVAPSEKDWDFPPPAATPTPSPTPAVVVPRAESRPSLYEIKRGDALVLIGQKFGLTVHQLQTFNGLKGDKIRAGQTLKIPTLAEAGALAPAPVSKPKSAAGASPSATPSENAIEINKFRLQIFLDREHFTVGPIVSDPGPPLTSLVALYESTHEAAKDDATLQAKAQATVPDVFTRYKLRAEDFRFIAPPKATAIVAQPVSTPARPGKTTPPRPGKTAPRLPVQKQSPLSYQEITAMPILAYRNPWEFVAERSIVRRPICVF